jgi:hypothetical protein
MMAYEPIRRAQDFFNESNMTLVNGIYTKDLKGDREEIVVVNDGSADLTINAGGIKDFKLKPGEVFDELVNPFSKVEITATEPFRGYCREQADSPN